MKAININPSNPIKFAKGCKNAALWFNMLLPPIFILARNQIIIPAGAAIAMARPSTNIVLSIIDVYSILPSCGFL